MKLSQAVKIVAPVVDNACGEPASKVDVRPEDVGGSYEPFAQMGLPGWVIEMTEVEC